MNLTSFLQTLQGPFNFLRLDPEELRLLVPAEFERELPAPRPIFLEDESATPLEGSAGLQGLKSVAALAEEKGDVPLPENESCAPTKVVKLGKGPRKGRVREGAF